MQDESSGSNARLKVKKNRGRYVQGEPRKVTVGDRNGNDLGDVLRDLLIEEMEIQGWTQTQLAHRLGMTQPNLSRILSQEKENPQDPDLGVLTALCIAIDENPVGLLQRHHLYEKTARSRVTFPKDHIFRRYNATLRNVEARGFLSLLEEARQLGVMDQCFAAIELAVDSARTAKRKSAIERRKSAPRRKAPG